MTEAPTVKCPQCGKAVKWVPQNAWRPFCSARCKALDLGAWAAESYRVPGSEGPDAAPRDEDRARD